MQAKSSLNIVEAIEDSNNYIFKRVPNENTMNVYSKQPNFVDKNKLCSFVCNNLSRRSRMYMSVDKAKNGTRLKKT